MIKCAVSRVRPVDGARHAAAHHDGRPVLPGDGHHARLQPRSQPQFVAKAAGRQVVGRHAGARSRAHQLNVGVGHAIDFLALRGHVPAVADDAVQVAVGARCQRGVARAGGRGGVIVPAVHKVGPAQQQVEAALHKLRPEPQQVVVAELVNHQHDDQPRFADGRGPARLLRSSRPDGNPEGRQRGQ